MAHSATHLVHAALREIVGPTATQAGSYNRPGYLRFDFSATAGLTKAMREDIEGRANEQIIADHEVVTKEMSLTEAKNLGAMAMFGEKYADEVRVVEMDGAWSRELCGGTHVVHSSQIGLLSLTTEASIGSGVRRVEALVGQDAFRQLAAERSLVMTLADTLKVQPDQLPDRVGKLMSQLKTAEKQITELRSAQLLSGAAELAQGATDVAGISFVAQHLVGIAAGDVRTLVNDVRDRLGARPGVVAIIGGTDTKPSLVVATTASARELGLDAGRLLGPGAQALGGKGGGKADIAQGGGTDAGQAETSFRAIAEAITTVRA